MAYFFPKNNSSKAIDVACICEALQYLTHYEIQMATSEKTLIIEI